MNLISTIIMWSLIGFGVVGLVVGFVKGFTNVKSWAVEYILAAVLTVALANLVRANVAQSEEQGYIILSIAIVLVVTFMMAFAHCRKFITKAISKHQKRQFYMDFENKQLRESEIVDALYVQDQKKYNKLVKTKTKYKRGPWGLVDRIFGSLTLGVKGVILPLIFFCTFLTILDLSSLTTVDQLSSSLSVFADYLNAGQWQYLKEFIFDFALIGLIFACIKNGYNGGLISSLWGLVMLVLVVLAAYIGWTLSGTEMFSGAVNGLTASLSGIYEQAGGIISAEWQTTISRIILTVGIFLIELVFIIILGILVPNLIDAARRGAAFRMVDGVMGAALSVVVLIVVFFLIGGILQTIADLEIMAHLNTYFELSKFAVYFYGDSLILAISPEVFNFLPLRKWLTGGGI